MLRTLPGHCQWKYHELGHTGENRHENNSMIILTIPSPSPSPKSQPQIPRWKGEFGLWDVTKILWSGGEGGVPSPGGEQEEEHRVVPHLQWEHYQSRFLRVCEWKWLVQILALLQIRIPGLSLSTTSGFVLYLLSMTLGHKYLLY